MDTLSHPNIIWPEPAGHPVLADKEAHVWAFSLDVSEERLAAFALTLSVDEQERAGRFYFERDRKRFIAGRGLVARGTGR